MVGCTADTNKLFRPDYASLNFVGEPVLDTFGVPAYGWYEESKPVNYKYVLGAVAALDIAAGAYNFYTWNGDSTAWTAIGSAEVAVGTFLGAVWSLSFI